MNSNFKKSAAIVVSALGVLTSAPSAFCAPKACPNSEKKNYNITKAPKKRENESQTSHTKIIPNRIISKKYMDGEIFQKRVDAPDAVAVEDYAFANQSHIKKVKLPKAVHVGSRAFENCENLEKIVFTDQLTSIAPDAFLGCRLDLKIIYKGLEYSVGEFAQEVKPYVKVNIAFGPYQPLDFKYYGKDKINLTIQPVGERIDDTTVEEDSSCSDTLINSETEN